VASNSRGLPKLQCDQICGRGPALTPVPGGKNIVQLAESVADLSFLATLIEGAGLTKTLSGPGPFTVFAPTNDAFAALPYSYVASLLSPANLTDLQKLLGFHVVRGIFDPQNLTDGLKINTLEGDPLQVAVFHQQNPKADGIYIGNPIPRPNDVTECDQLRPIANATNCDVKLRVQRPGVLNKASNGLVYIIGGLLVPPGANPIPPPDHPRPSPFDGPNIARACNKKSCLFSFTNKPGGCCGEVDAAPHMPPGIWSDPSAVEEYVRLTTVFSSTVPRTLPPYEPCYHPGNCPTHEFLTLGSCTDGEFHRNWVQDGNRSIDWSAGFENWCKTRCGCGISGTDLHAQKPCKDVPDDPATHHFCSLCGPKYNTPIAVQLYHPKGGSSAKCLGV
jgi:uncharacterized surface protein with fasciclin (FAS1) repeats